jgi:hypothetical protein
VVESCGVITAGIGIESVQLKYVRDTAPTLLSFDVDDEIDQITNLALDGLIGHSDVAGRCRSAPPRTSPMIKRSGLWRSVAFTKSRIVTADIVTLPEPSVCSLRASKRNTFG